MYREVTRFDQCFTNEPPGFYVENKLYRDRKEVFRIIWIREGIMLD